MELVSKKFKVPSRISNMLYFSSLGLPKNSLGMQLNSKKSRVSQQQYYSEEKILELYLFLRISAAQFLIFTVRSVEKQE